MNLSSKKPMENTKEGILERLKRLQSKQALRNQQFSTGKLDHIEEKGSTLMPEEQDLLEKENPLDFSAQLKKLDQDQIQEARKGIDRSIDLLIRQELGIQESLILPTGHLSFAGIFLKGRVDFGYPDFSMPEVKIGEGVYTYQHQKREYTIRNKKELIKMIENFKKVSLEKKLRYLVLKRDIDLSVYHKFEQRWISVYSDEISYLDFSKEVLFKESISEKDFDDYSAVYLKNSLLF